MDTLAKIGEFGLIDKITKISNLNFPVGMLGPGDDCAVFAPGVIGDSSTEWQLITTDMLVENRHFRLSYYQPEDIGWKLIATSVSDIAAMGGEPKAIVISLALPKSTTVSLVEGIYRGIREAEEVYGVLVVGGDTVSASEISMSASVIGTTKQKPFLRSGAHVGDDIWVSGCIGSAYAGLMLLEGLAQEKSLTSTEREVLERAQKRPKAQVALGQKLAEIGLVSSMIDVSDGLLQDMAHITEMSGVSAVIDISEVPISSLLIKSGITTAKAVTGGEDYSLLFTAPKLARSTIENITGSFTVHRIGEMVETGNPKGEVLIVRNGIVLTVETYLSEGAKTTATGFSHF